MLKILLSFVLVLTLNITSASANETVLPDFSGAQSDFRDYRTRITEAMLNGPNFAQHYTLITIGCGTSCIFGFVGNNRTGELYSLPFGGEANSQMQLEFDLNSNILKISFQNNPLLETADGWVSQYAFGESPCAAYQLKFDQGIFVEEVFREAARFGRYCPLASELLQVNSRGLSEFEEECFSELTRFNLCDEAKSIANFASESLPIRIDSELRILSLIAEGPILSLNAQWDLSPDELEARLLANNMTMQQLRVILEQTAKTNICNAAPLLAYQRLGGRFIYTYINANYTTIHRIEIQRSD
tara:strand:- start:196 stop:1098 length:903 start_codon:yes stop_codon:yes gene_type:complete